MTTETTRILAVIDPTQLDQWALQRAVSIAKDRDDAVVYAFLSTFSNAENDDTSELRTVELRRHTLWLQEIVDGYAADEVEIEPIVDWSEDWREGACKAALDNSIDLVVKRASGKPSSLASSDRYLIRNLPSALLLVKHDPVRALHRVLVAVDFNASDKSHLELNDAVMSLGRRLRGASNRIELHAVSAYPESDKFIHPPDVAKTLEIDRSQAHVRNGRAADVIPATASKIDADLVIIGNVGRRGLSGIAVGNTSEKILTDIESDVLILVREEEGERSAA